MYTVFIIEEDDLLRDSIRLLFKSEGFYCLTYKNGLEALRTIYKRVIPDIIISAISLPVYDGIQFYNKLQTESRLEGIPFILLTDKNENDFLISSLKIDTTEYLSKPFKSKELLDKVKSKLEHQISQN